MTLNFGPPGAELLRTATTTAISIPAGPHLSAYLPCTFYQNSGATPWSRPSHILAIRSPGAIRTLLLPVHGLLWAAKSPVLSLLSSAPAFQPASVLLPSFPAPTPTSLPVLELSLPSTRALPLLQGWIYLSSATLLKKSLLPCLPSSLASPEPKSAAELAASLSRLHASVLLDGITLIHALWQIVVALEISSKSDEVLWKTMRSAWGTLVAALALQQERRRAAPGSV